MSGYRELLRDPRVRGLYVVGFFARMPPLAAPLAFTLHVVKDLDGSYAQAGLVAAVNTIGAAIGMPWRGRAIDRIGLRRALIPSLVVVALLYPVAALAPYWFLVPVAFVMGVFLIPIFSAVRQALTVMVAEPRHRAAFSLDSAITEASFIIGPAIGVLLVTQFGAGAALAFIGMCEVIAGVVLWRMNPPTRTVTDTEETADEASPTRWISLALVLMFVAGGGSTFALYSADLGIIATLEETDRTAAIALVYALWGGGSLLGGLIYGALSTSLRPSHLLLALGLLTIPVGLAHEVWVLALAVIPCGMLCAPTLTAVSEWVTKLSPESRRGEAMGWFGTAHTAGIALAGPVIGGAIDLVGPWGGFALGGVVASIIALAILAVSGLRRSVDPQPSQPSFG